MPLDEFEEYGVGRMDDDRIRGFLSSQRVGVLGLETERAPSMRPLSYWYDGGSTLYFQFLGGDGGRKAALASAADAARFLVYRVETRFNWRSVLLTGTIEPVPEEERATVEEQLELQRPDALEATRSGEETSLYAFDVEERTGVEHLGLPPGFEDDG